MGGPLCPCCDGQVQAVKNGHPQVDDDKTSSASCPRMDGASQLGPSRVTGSARHEASVSVGPSTSPLVPV